MKTIIQPNKMFSLLIGKQKNTNCNYRKMNYIVTTEIDKGLLAYNTISTELIFLNNKEKCLLTDNKSNVNDTLKQLLIEKFFLVPNAYNEYDLYNQFFSTLHSLIKENGINFYKILTTNDCNARCFYCYKLDAIHETMSSSTAKTLINYIIKHHDRSKEVHLYWFGGEPLMNINCIDSICRAMQKNLIEYYSTIITNGYLFDYETVKKAVNDWNVKLIQITLDGKEETHNRTKAFIYNDVNPYIKIMNNIEKLLINGLKVTIRLNMDNYNKNELFELTDELHLRFSKYENLSMYPALLSDAVSFHRDDKRSFDEASNLYDDYMQMRHSLYLKGLLNVPKLSQKTKLNCCMADSDNGIVVLPDGRFAKCDLCAEESVFGGLYTTEINEEIIKVWKERTNTKENCSKCSLLPFCVKIKNCKEVPDFCNSYHIKAEKQMLEFSMINAYKNFIRQ